MRMSTTSALAAGLLAASVLPALAQPMMRDGTSPRMRGDMMQGERMRPMGPNPEARMGANVPGPMGAKPVLGPMHGPRPMMGSANADAAVAKKSVQDLGYIVVGEPREMGRFYQVNALRSNGTPITLRVLPDNRVILAPQG